MTRRGPDRSEGESEDLDTEFTTTAVTEGDKEDDVLLLAQPSRPKVRGARPLRSLTYHLSMTDVVTLELLCLGTPRAASHREVPHSLSKNRGYVI